MDQSDPLKVVPRSMEETSVPVFNKSPNSKSSTSFSPNTNPFNCTWKKTMDAISVTEQTNRRSSIRLPTDFSHIDKNSVKFLDLNVSDFGRESLGILPPDFGRDSLGFMNMSNLETNRESLGILQISALKDFGRESVSFLTSDFGKESLGFRCTNKIEANRESLGILQSNALRDSLSFGRESLGILNLQDFDREYLDCGRESLGILHLKSSDTRFGDEEKCIPDLMLTSAEENSYEPNHILDTAFLQPNSRKSSTLSSISSFNSLWLEGPSRIYSVSSVKTDVGSNTPVSPNFSSYNTELSSVHSLFNNGKIFSPNELELRSRIQSVPDKLTPPKRKMENLFWSADRTTQIKSLDRNYRECIDFGADRSSEFHDSVFIKGNSTSENLVDGSNESFACGALDCTSEPEWPDEDNATDKKENNHQKCDTETAFKTVDKMLPHPVKEIIEDKLKTSKIGNNKSSESVEKIKTKDDSDGKIIEANEQNISKLLHNISDIQHEPKKNSYIQKQPKEILENLSLLLNCTNPSDKQKSEGQSLLNTLADMLCESKTSSKNNFDDSGHSSINEHSDSPNNKDQECFEVLDLRLKGTEPNTANKSEILDLSLKSKAIEDIKDKRLSRSLCLPSPNKKVFSDPGIKSESASSLHLSNSKSSNSSADSNDSKNIGALIKPNIAGKLRQKTCRSSLKRGPMKAIIPVGEMRKNSKAPVTPDRSEQKVLNMQSKRTSTPINEPKMKPIAASTPSYSTNEPRLNKKSADSSLDKSKSLNASNTSIQHKADISGLPRPSMTNMGYRLRTNSLGDIKKPSEMSWRRNSVGKESTVMSSVAKARQNLGSPYYRSIKQNSQVELQNKEKLEEKRHTSITRLSNIESKCKTIKNTMPKKPKQNLFTAGSSAKIVFSPQLKNCNSSTSSQSHSNPKVGVQYGKKNSTGSELGRKSCLSQIKQNLLSSPHFNLEKDNCLNKNSVLSENQELNKINKTGISKCPQLKKAGKENTGL